MSVLALAPVRILLLSYHIVILLLLQSTLSINKKTYTDFFDIV